MFPLTKKELKLHQDAAECYICRKRFLKKFVNKNYRKVRHHCHFTGKYIENKIPVVFHNALNYDYHFIIKKLPNKFEGQFECLGENTEKYKTFSIPVEKKVTNIDKASDETLVTNMSQIMKLLQNKIY